MLNYNILNYKPNIQIGDEYGIDLLYKSLKYSLDDYNLSGQFIYVNEYYVARPDLISLAAYNTDKYGDIICKINGISNPFELNEDDIIYLPDVDTLMDCCKGAENQEEIVMPDDQILFSKKNKNDHKKKVTERRSSNEQIEGDKLFTIDKTLGLIIF